MVDLGQIRTGLMWLESMMGQAKVNIPKSLIITADLASVDQIEKYVNDARIAVFNYESIQLIYQSLFKMEGIVAVIFDQWHKFPSTLQAEFIEFMKNEVPDIKFLTVFDDND